VWQVIIAAIDSPLVRSQLELVGASNGECLSQVGNVQREGSAIPGRGYGSLQTGMSICRPDLRSWGYTSSTHVAERECNIMEIKRAAAEAKAPVSPREPTCRCRRRRRGDYRRFGVSQQLRLVPRFPSHPGSLLKPTWRRAAQSYTAPVSRSHKDPPASMIMNYIQSMCLIRVLRIDRFLLGVSIFLAIFPEEPCQTDRCR
jgi:hypothetical protein